MDKILCDKFSHIPKDLIFYYILDDNTSNTLSKVDKYIGMYKKKIIESRNCLCNKMGNLNIEKINEYTGEKFLREKISSFTGIKELVMDDFFLRTFKRSDI